MSNKEFNDFTICFGKSPSDFWKKPVKQKIFSIVQQRNWWICYMFWKISFGNFLARFAQQMPTKWASSRSVFLRLAGRHCGKEFPSEILNSRPCVLCKNFGASLRGDRCLLCRHRIRKKPVKQKYFQLSNKELMNLLYVFDNLHKADLRIFCYRSV